MRVLVVDDHSLFRDVLIRSIRAAGHIDGAVGYSSALEMLGTATYDAIVSDDKMPDGTGHALLTMVRERQPHCRRALMSSTAERDENGLLVWHEFFRKSATLAPDVLAWLRTIPIIPIATAKSETESA